MMNQSTPYFPSNDDRGHCEDRGEVWTWAGAGQVEISGGRLSFLSLVSHRTFTHAPHLVGTLHDYAYGPPPTSLQPFDLSGHALGGRHLDDFSNEVVGASAAGFGWECCRGAGEGEDMLEQLFCAGLGRATADPPLVRPRPSR